MLLLLPLLQSQLSKELSSLTSLNSLPLWADAENVNISKKKKEIPSSQHLRHPTQTEMLRHQGAGRYVQEKGIPDDSSLQTNGAAAEWEESRGRTHLSGTQRQYTHTLNIAVLDRPAAGRCVRAAGGNKSHPSSS